MTVRQLYKRSAPHEKEEGTSATRIKRQKDFSKGHTSEPQHPALKQQKKKNKPKTPKTCGLDGGGG